MVVLGYIGAGIMGLSLGLIGGGGSILAVPILVYLFGIAPEEATVYSLFVVGLTSLTGSLNHLRMGNIHWPAVFWFGLPSITAVFFTRFWVIPALPDPVFSFDGFVLHKDNLLLLAFALVMVLAAWRMIRRKEKADRDSTEKPNFTRLTLQGLLVGFITGMLGAGGGFLIIPALVVLARLPMKRAIGTSLVVIACNALLGFLISLGHLPEIDWKLLLTFAAVATAGIILGSQLTRKIAGSRLRNAFGWFVLAMGIYIIAERSAFLF